MIGKKFTIDWLCYLFFICPGFLLILDLMLLGSGFWSEPLGFSVRKVFFAMVCIYSAAYWVQIFYKRISEYVAVLTLMLFLVIWCLLVPLLKNVGLKDAFSDAQLFIGLLFAPAIYSVIEIKGCWKNVSSVIFRVALLLAFFHIGVGFFDLIFPESTFQLIGAIKNVLEPLRSEEETSVFIGYVGDNIRVFWGSSIYLLVGFYLAVKSLSVIGWIRGGAALLVISAAIFLTLTRGIILSIPIFLVIFFILKISLKQSSNIFLFYFYFIIFLIFITVPIVFLSDPSVLTWIGVGREGSDNIRSEQVFSLLRSFEANFLVGTGFGASSNDVRSESAPWSYEMSILALYMKIGLVGIFCLTIVVFSFFISKKDHYLDKRELVHFSRLAALTTVVVFCGNTNPYLFSMLGVGLFLFIYFEFRSFTFILKNNQFAEYSSERINS